VTGTDSPQSVAAPHTGSPASSTATIGSGSGGNGAGVIVGSSRGTPPGQTDYGFWPTMERIVRQPPLALSPDDGYSPELCDFIAVWYLFSTCSAIHV
jgi:hypothetical protein